MNTQNLFFGHKVLACLIGLSFNLSYAKSVCIAHRGYHTESIPENSMESIEKVINEEIEGMELDIRFSQDHVPIVFHDARLGQKISGTCSNANAGKISKQNWYGAMDACTLSNGQHIPTLDQVLKVVVTNSYSGIVFLEFKDLSDSFLEKMDAYKGLLAAIPYGHLIVSSFDETILNKLKSLGLPLHHLAVQNKEKGTLAPAGYDKSFHGIDFFYPNGDIQESRERLDETFASLGKLGDEIKDFGDKTMKDAPPVFGKIWDIGKKVVGQVSDQVEDNVLNAVITEDEVRQRLANGRHQIGLWTINDGIQLQELYALGESYPASILYLITDYPPKCQ